MDYSRWGCKESDMTEVPEHACKLTGDVRELVNAFPVLLRLRSFENHLIRFFRKSHVKPVISLVSMEVTFFCPLFRVQSSCLLPDDRLPNELPAYKKNLVLCVKYERDLS